MGSEGGCTGTCVRRLFLKVGLACHSGVGTVHAYFLSGARIGHPPGHVGEAFLYYFLSPRGLLFLMEELMGLRRALGQALPWLA